MNKILLNLLLCSSVAIYAQETPQNISQVFEYDDPKMELARLEEKKINLENRLIQLKSDSTSDPAEISRVQGTINYLDAKIESLEKQILSIEYAEKEGMPEQGNLSDEEYQQKLKNWKKEHQQKDSGNEQIIKTTLTREEFNKLPKERQEKILSMPERYTIID